MITLSAVSLICALLFGVPVTQLDALALNIYHEARGQSELGQIAVSHVVLNRAQSPIYPNTIKEVIYQKNQFSWTEDDKHDAATDTKAALAAYKLADRILYGKTTDPTHGALFYNTRAVKPFRSDLILLITIGDHNFYGLPNEKQQTTKDIPVGTNDGL